MTHSLIRAAAHVLAAADRPSAADEIRVQVSQLRRATAAPDTAAIRNTLVNLFLSWPPVWAAGLRVTDDGAVVRTFGRKGRWKRVITTPYPSLQVAWPFIRTTVKTRLRHHYRIVESS